MSRLVVAALLLMVLGAASGSLAYGAEVTVYPDEWLTDSWGQVTIISGGLSDVQSSNDAYMVARCSATTQNSSLKYRFHTGYTPGQVSKITVEYEFHTTYTNTPSHQFYLYKPAGGSTYMGGGLWTTTDQWFTWNTTDVTSHMDGSGVITVGLCGCHQNSNIYDTSVDVVRIKLEVAGGNPPVANFTGSPTTGNAPLAVSFTDTSTNTPTAWSWTFGDSSTSTVQNPSHTYAVGTFTVSLTATSAYGSDGETKTNYIVATVAPPAANFTGSPTSGTVPLTVNFTDTSTNTPTSWSWSFGDSGTSTVQNPSHQYTSTGSFTVTLTATNAGGSDGETKTNYITVSAGGSTPTFIAAGAVASGTGAITPALPAGIAANDILLLFLETANQAISISNQNGGTWTAVASSPQGTGTAGGSSATRLTAFWSRYNGTQGAPTTSDSGNHQAGRMIAIRGCATSGNPWDMTAGGVESTADTSGSIPGATTTVANTLVVAAIATSLPDASGTANFSAWANANLVSVTERIDNTRSAGNGGGLGLATGGKATAGAYGNTTVTCTTSAAKGLLSIALKPAGVGSPPVANFTGSPTSGTAPLAVAFTDTSTNTPTAWSWSFGDSNTSTVQNPSHSYAAGTYTVSLTATNAYGSDGETKTSYVTATVAPPVADFTGTPTSGAAPLAVTFTDTSTNSPTAWSWNFGDSNTSTAQNPSHTYAAGTYTVTLTATNAGGSDGETKANYITATAPAPIADFTGSPRTGAPPLAVSFTDTSTGSPTSWSWNFGDSGTSTVQNPSHTYTSNGNYTVSLTATNAAGSDGETKTNYITVSSLPSEVIVYPDTWGKWNNETLLSGGLTDLQSDNGVYMAIRCDTSNHIYGVWYTSDTSYHPSQVAAISVEYQAKNSRSDTPGSGFPFVRTASGGWEFENNWKPGTGDTWFTWSTGNAGAYMNTAGVIGFEFCGCPSGSNNYDISSDVMQFRLTMNTTAPAAPTNAQATPMGQTEIKVSWTDNANNEYQFLIQRKIGAGGVWADLTSVGANVVEYYDNDLTPGTTYYYRIRAWNAIGDSAWSNEASGTTLGGGAPVAPSNLVAKPKSATQIDLYWADNSMDENSFLLEVAIGGGGFNYLATIDRCYTRYSHTGLTAGQTYNYRLYATNGYGNSSYTNTASTSPQAWTVVTVSSLPDLRTAITNAAPRTIIQIASGSYLLDVNGIEINDKTDLTIRSQTGNRSDVVIHGNGIEGYPEYCFKLYRSDFITLQDMTLRDVYWHCIQTNEGSEYSTYRNLYMWDAGEGPIKGTSPGATGPFSDYGWVEDCVFGYTNGSTRGSIEGIDIVALAGWVVRDSQFYNAYGDPYYTSSPGWGMFAKGNSMDTIIENCYFENCGIAMSFGGGGTGVQYFRNGDATYEHRRGIMRNNVVHNTNDVAIYMNSAQDYSIYNNTLWSTFSGANSSIDIRYNSWGRIYNNTCHQSYQLRDGGLATVSNNLWNVDGSLFVNQPGKDYHLVSSATSAINQGRSPDGWVNFDMDWQSRPRGAAWDIGADEY